MQPVYTYKAFANINLLNPHGVWDDILEFCSQHTRHTRYNHGVHVITV